MEEILKRINSIGVEVTVNACYGVYDTVIRIKYGVDPLDLAWVYLKDNKIIYMNIKNDTFTDLDALLNRVKELSEVIR